MRYRTLTQILDTADLQGKSRGRLSVHMTAKELRTKNLRTAGIQDCCSPLVHMKTLVKYMGGTSYVSRLSLCAHEQTELHMYTTA